MGKVITLFNFKNGVGKTTIAYNLAKHLDCEIYEESDDYLSLISGETKVFKSDLLGAKQGVYDLNINNTYKIKYILSKSDYILIPTQADYKDLIKTAASLKYIESINTFAQVIVVFNMLNPVYKKTEVPYTEEAIKFLKDSISISQSKKLNFNICYIRMNKAWFENSIQGKYYLDIFRTTLFWNMIESDSDIYFSLSNDKVLEILFQYTYYYNPIYKTKSKLKNKNKPFSDSEIKKIREDFEKEKLENGIMTSYNEDLYELLIGEFYNEISKEFRYRKHNNKNYFEVYGDVKLDIKKIENNDIEQLEYLEQREKIIHFCLSHLFNLKKALEHKKIIRDMRNLLIEIKEFNI